MSATAHLTHLVPTHRRRHDGGLARLRVRIRRADLDRRLAEGEVPMADDPDLTRRAVQLTEGAERRRIAMAVDHLVAEASGPPARFSSKVPLARAAINACAPRMQAIAGRLWGDIAVSPRGVAKLSELLREGTSPFYSLSTTEDGLRHTLAQIANALEV